VGGGGGGVDENRATIFSTYAMPLKVATANFTLIPQRFWK